MLDLKQLAKIEWLSAGGLSIADIARGAGCSRPTVRLVLAGRHPLQTRALRPKPLLAPPGEPTDPIRCTGCGGKICELPCRLCACASFGEKKRSHAEARRRGGIRER